MFFIIRKYFKYGVFDKWLLGNNFYINTEEYFNFKGKLCLDNILNKSHIPSAICKRYSFLFIKFPNFIRKTYQEVKSRFFSHNYSFFQELMDEYGILTCKFILFLLKEDSSLSHNKCFTYRKIFNFSVIVVGKTFEFASSFVRPRSYCIHWTFQLDVNTDYPRLLYLVWYD